MPTPPAETSSDTIVVGGRLAGALTAAHLAAAGLRVVVLESSSVSFGTMSTHFSRGDGLVRALRDVGALDAEGRKASPNLK